jgi:hypothetical protein
MDDLPVIHLCLFGCGLKPKIDEANEAIEALEKLLADIIRDWREANRIIGHVILSPQLRFTEDWVVEIHPTKIARLNFIGNAIDLGSVEAHELITWMYSNLTTLATVCSGALGPSQTTKCSVLIRVPKITMAIRPSWS